ncbi:MAG: RAD55 family ATPase [Methanomassiliicoccales archaeon]|nr:RAD55 family ATPase [Methanomassiliicoccales archaeon]MDD1755667.1 RAD55 family ATPase [Methanomassiliicoccales archaeon]
MNSPSNHAVPIMFKNSISGLEKVFKTDIEAPKVVLVTGPPGSMKTSFCYSLMSSYLEKSKEFGLYVTLEESGDSHLRNMRSLGLKVSPSLEISDFSDLRELDEIIEVDNPTDYVQFIEQMLTYYKKKHGDHFTVFTLDSLGALYSLMEDSEGMRKKMFYFFKTLRDLNLMSFIVMERSPNTPSELLGNEGFLVDGIIEMGLDRSKGKMVRYVRVEKMRACEHSMERHTVEVAPGSGMTVLGPSLA